MAIRERQGRASPWQCYWNNPFTGKRESANFATKEEALKHDSLIKHRLKFERESFRKEDDENAQEEKITLEQAYLLYLREKQFNKQALHWQMQSMQLPLQLFGTKAINDIIPQDIIEILDAHKQKMVSDATVHGRMSVLRAVMRWCADKGLCSYVRFPKLPSARYEKFIPPTSEELSAMFQWAPEHIGRVIIIGSQCGLRVGACEMFKLKWSDIDLTRQVITVQGSKKNSNNPWREIPIKQDIFVLFKQWFAQDRVLGVEYVIHYKGKPVQSIKNAWWNTLKRAGISRRIRPYDLRHAFATELIAAGVDIGTVAKLMGHSSPAMILNHYQYVMSRQKRLAVEALPELAYVSKHMCPNKGATAQLP